MGRGNVLQPHAPQTVAKALLVKQPSMSLLAQSDSSDALGIGFIDLSFLSFRHEQVDIFF